MRRRGISNLFFPDFYSSRNKNSPKTASLSRFWGVLFFWVCRYVFVLVSLTPYAGISSSPNAFKISENTSHQIGPLLSEMVRTWRIFSDALPMMAMQATHPSALSVPTNHSAISTIPCLYFFHSKTKAPGPTVITLFSAWPNRRKNGRSSFRFKNPSPNLSRHPLPCFGPAFPALPSSERIFRRF